MLVDGKEDGWSDESSRHKPLSSLCCRKKRSSANLPAWVSTLWEDCLLSSSRMTASPHLLVSAKKADLSSHPLQLSGISSRGWHFNGIGLSWWKPVFIRPRAFLLIYEILNCLTFSFLGTQFIKTNPRWKWVRSADSLLCERGAERPCLLTSGPCPDLPHMTNCMMSEQDPPTVRLECCPTQGNMHSGPLTTAGWGSSQTTHKCGLQRQSGQFYFR